MSVAMKHGLSTGWLAQLGSAMGSVGSAVHGPGGSLAAHVASRGLVAHGVSAKAYSSEAKSPKASFTYCIDQVRKFDYDNYIWVTQQPKDLRASLFALRAFNIELVQIADQVSGLSS
eukprot:gene14326-20312_t